MTVSVVISAWNEEEKIAQRVEQFRNQEVQQEAPIQQTPVEEKAPIDWLSPKVYKGSSNV